MDVSRRKDDRITTLAPLPFHDRVINDGDDIMPFPLIQVGCPGSAVTLFTVLRSAYK
jgi:hypothetical protein